MGALCIPNSMEVILSLPMPECSRDVEAATVLRVALPEEAAALAAIAWAAKSHWGYAEADMQAWRDGLTPSARSIAQQPTFVAERGGKLAGFCQLNLDAAPVELEHLWVLPRFMGQGLGRALLGRAVAELSARGVPLLRIDSDPNAEVFYRACGATRVGTRAAPAVGQPDRVRPQLDLCVPRCFNREACS